MLETNKEVLMRGMSRKREWIVVIICILLAGLICFAIYTFKNGRSPLESLLARRPFKDLEASEIVSAKVRLTPPDTTLRLVDTETLADCLQDVKIYRKDNSYTEYCGQGVIFSLTLSDGTQTEVMTYSPFLVIDGVGYRTAYEPCEALHSYANRLLQEGEAPVVMEEPPLLDVISDAACVAAMTGTCSWRYGKLCVLCGSCRIRFFMTNAADFVTFLLQCEKIVL